MLVFSHLKHSDLKKEGDSQDPGTKEVYKSHEFQKVPRFMNPLLQHQTIAEKEKTLCWSFLQTGKQMSKNEAFSSYHSYWSGLFGDIKVHESAMLL